MKIIGIEYRILTPQGRALELAVFPLDVVYPSLDCGQVHWNVTTHTTEGDSTIDSRQNGSPLPMHDYRVEWHRWEKSMREIILKSHR